jgi:dienelactone hydrolase
MSCRIPAVVLVCLVAACGSGSNDAPPDAVDAAPARADAAPDVLGCSADGRFLATSADPAAPGPWPTGARTVRIGRLTAEVFYPATPGSDAGRAPARYDIREHLPASERAKIADADNPWQACDCYRDLPLDEAHGPYPAVVFIHGTAGFRTQSLGLATHWASRGFVVVAADHPGLFLGDLLSLACLQPQTGARTIAADVDAELAALAAAATTSDLAFLAGHLDLTRVAVAGHSAGASETAALTSRPGVRVAIAMAGATAVQASPTLAATLGMAAESDGVVDYAASRQAYDASPAPRYWVGVRHSGHLCFSDLCALENAAGDNLLDVAVANDVCGATLAGGLYDCNPEFIPGATALAIVRHATTAVLEDTLRCTGSLAALPGMAERYPDVLEVLATP